jgi:peroxiredoxin
MINVNETLPNVTFSLRQNGEASNPTTSDLFAGKKVVVFAIPGAFTPTCSEAHLPGFVVHAGAFKDKGVDSIICLSVNDAFVMEAWGQDQNAGDIVMLADGGAEFTKAIGLDMDTATFGGVRSQRYAMVVDNGVVTALNIDKPGQFEESSAEAVLAIV